MANQFDKLTKIIFFQQQKQHQRQQQQQPHQRQHQQQVQQLHCQKLNFFKAQRVH